mmetsp:Transcript_83141/g.222179  ORF Transcript_83141/g.222179 Transcript_83141/m.222179 type:complete len:89 (-) Transcript_83141:89-355(-)
MSVSTSCTLQRACQLSSGCCSREDWKPVLSISAVVYGLVYLFLEPNPSDPLNREAADALRANREEFARLVQRSLRGQSVAGQTFPRLV